MAVLPTYVSPQAPDTIAKLGLESGDHVQNWMTQAAHRENINAQTEATRLQSDKIRAAMPALIAKGESDRIAAQTDIAAASLMQRLRGEWQSLKPQVIQDIAAVEDPNNHAATEDGTTDWEDKYHQYESLQAKYGQLKLFPEGKAYYDMLDNAKKNAFDMASRHATAQAHLDAIKAAGEAGMGRAEVTTQGRENVARIAAGAKTEAAKTGAAAKIGAAEINTGAAMARTEMTGFNRAAADYENLALKEPDPAKAAAYIEKANALRDKAHEVAHPPAEEASPEITLDIPGNTPATGDAEEADLPAEAGGPGAESPAAEAAPAANASPAAAASKTKETAGSVKPGVAPTKLKASDIKSKNGVRYIEISGKPYVLQKDANGHIAYKLGGHWIEVQTE